jgi:hypothetical protein
MAKELESMLHELALGEGDDDVGFRKSPLIPPALVPQCLPTQSIDGIVELLGMNIRSLRILLLP